MIDVYVRKAGPLHRLDPRVKIIGAVMLTVLCFFLSNLSYLLALLIFMQLLMLLTRVSSRIYLRTIWLAVRLAIIFVLIWPFFDQAGEPMLLDLWVYKVTLPGFLRSLAVAARILLIASGWFILIFTTSQSQLVRGMVKLGLRYDLGLSISIGLRYLPRFLGTMDQIKEAQMSRGFDMRKGGPITKAKNYIPILIPTIAIAMRTADELSQVLVCKGYGASKRRTYLRELQMRKTDGLALFSIASLGLLLILLDIIGLVQL